MKRFYDFRLLEMDHRHFSTAILLFACFTYPYLGFALPLKEAPTKNDRPSVRLAEHKGHTTNIPGTDAVEFVHKSVQRVLNDVGSTTNSGVKSEDELSEGALSFDDTSEHFVNKHTIKKRRDWADALIPADRNERHLTRTERAQLGMHSDTDSDDSMVHALQKQLENYIGDIKSLFKLDISYLLHPDQKSTTPKDEKPHKSRPKRNIPSWLEDIETLKILSHFLKNKQRSHNSKSMFRYG